MNIFEKMSAITNELAPIAKKLEVKIGSRSYKAVSEADVLRPVKEIEAKNGIYSYPSSRRIVDKGVITNSTGSQSLYLRIETEYTFVNMEKPEEKITMITYGDGVDPQDKAPGKRNDIFRQICLIKSI